MVKHQKVSKNYDQDCRTHPVIFQNCLKQGVAADDRKKGNIIPVQKKKNNKQLVNNYQPVSLLPIFSKILENLIFYSIYGYIGKNKFLNGHQSGFKTSYSCIYEFIAITHHIFKAFDANPSLEVRGIFLDLSEAFDRVWHDGLLYKLKSNGIDGSLFELIESFLDDRHEIVVFNGQSSD